MCHKVHECQGVSVLHAVYGQKQSSVIAISLEEEQAQSQEIQKKSVSAILAPIGTDISSRQSY